VTDLHHYHKPRPAPLSSSGDLARGRAPTCSDGHAPRSGASPDFTRLNRIRRLHVEMPCGLGRNDGCGKYVAEALRVHSKSRRCRCSMAAYIGRIDAYRPHVISYATPASFYSKMRLLRRPQFALEKSPCAWPMHAIVGVYATYRNFRSLELETMKCISFAHSGQGEKDESLLYRRPAGMTSSV
jgi:hypothetical protein